MEIPKVFLVGLRGAVGSLEITAEELGRKFGISPSEIERKTGVTRLFRFSLTETLESVSLSVVQQMLQGLNFDLGGIRGVFASSNTTTKTLMPGYAASVGAALGLRHVLADQVGMGCGGGLQALRAAYDRLVVHGLYQERATYLVIAGDATSLILNPDDYATGFLFSEGVSALLVTNDPTLANNGYEITRVQTKSFLEGLEALQVGNPYWPTHRGTLPPFTMEGRGTFRFGAELLPHFLELVGEKEFGSDWMLFPHQANVRMLQAMARNGGIPESQVYMEGIRTIGNTSPPAVFLGLEDGLRRELFDAANTTVLLGAFGAELTVGAALLKPLGIPSAILR